MSVEYEKYIQPRKDKGMTNAEIAAELSTLYVKDCMATGSKDLYADPDLLHILGGAAKMIRVGVDATWKGPLVDYMNAVDQSDPDPAVAALNQQLVAGFELLLSQLQITGRTVHVSTNTETAYLTTAITTIVKGLLTQWGIDSPATVPMQPDDLQQMVDDATGGIVWPDCTEADIDASEAQYQSGVSEQQRQDDIQALVTEIENDWINPAVADGSSTPESVRAAIKAGL